MKVTTRPVPSSRETRRSRVTEVSRTPVSSSLCTGKLSVNILKTQRNIPLCGRFHKYRDVCLIFDVYFPSETLSFIRKGNPLVSQFSVLSPSEANPDNPGFPFRISLKRKNQQDYAIRTYFDQQREFILIGPLVVRCSRRPDLLPSYVTRRVPNPPRHRIGPRVPDVTSSALDSQWWSPRVVTRTTRPTRGSSP